MSRHNRRSRREPGLLEIAATSDWKVAAGMSSVCALAAVFIIPVVFGGSRVLGSLVPVFSTPAWLMAAVFGVIALVRFSKQRAAVTPSVNAIPHDHKREPRTSANFAPLSDRDKVLLNMTFGSRPSDSQSERPTTWSREVLDRIEWKGFEDLCCEFYRVKGIRAETTRLGADGGVDIRLFQNDANPKNCTAVVQCKAWNQAVGVKSVRELRGVMAHEKVEKAFFMVPNGFTDGAKAFAAENRITLLDGRLFLAMLERLPETQRKTLLAFATAGDWTTPTCPACGLKMTAREGKRGRFWGCVSYPRCRGVLQMRSIVN